MSQTDGETKAGAADAFSGRTVETARRALRARLQIRDDASAELDARLLLGEVLGLDLTGLMLAANRVIADDEAARLQAFARRRLDGEPVARILGVREFWGLPLRLCAETLVPRPDTETLIEAALDIVSAERRRDDPLRIADLGTGSGAILLALLSELPHAFGIGTDIDPVALRTARDNARQSGFAAHAGFVACDYASALNAGFDLIVSNPPYIRSADIADLAVEVRDHDPRRALDGGPDGLDAYRTIAPAAARLLAPGGILIVELGHDQSDAVADLVIAAGLTLCGPPRRDLSGIRRALTARRSSR